MKKISTAGAQRIENCLTPPTCWRGDSQHQSYKQSLPHAPSPNDLGSRAVAKPEFACPSQREVTCYRCC